jgi:predicted house-cleaning noncanonical NTP pyrophosphatase (MazG superfamily)
MSAATGAAPPPPPAAKIDPGQTREICDQFKSLFKENEELYANQIQIAVTKYFGNDEMLKTLNDTFSEAVLEYLKSQSFMKVSQEEVKTVLREILRKPIEEALEDKELYKGVCQSIIEGKDVTKVEEKEGGKPIAARRRRTKSNRKSRKTTIKRRR